MSHTAELIAVGTELLLGNIANTDAQMISEGLSQLGINVYYHTVVGDNPERVRQAVDIARQRADILITTGGLGPTCDDLTKVAVAQAFGRTLVYHEPSAQRIRDRFAAMGRPVTENNFQQAMIPEGATVLDNDWGTAPGVAMEADGIHVLMLPGPPRECEMMFRHRAVPYLKGLSEGVIVSRTVKTFGIGESAAEALLRDLMNSLHNPTLAHPSGLLNIRRVEELCRVLSDLKNAGHEIILVSSGAIGMGAGKLSLPHRPEDTPTKQAAAAVGQCELMYTYDKAFAEYNHTVAQILLTAADVDHPDRFQNFHNTMRRLLDLKALPIINENDTVATEEMGIGDNDTLAAVVAVSMEADLLILLSDIDGLYTADPHTHPEATLIAEIPALTREIWELAGGSGSSLGTGGMSTKLQAADICTQAGCDMVIANGSSPSVLYDIADGKPVGSRFRGKKG